MASPLKNSSVSENQNQKQDCLVSNGTESNGKEAEEVVGVLEVFIHQARDIHNICIYHKQDVYARLSFTSDPAQAVSTKIINGGGRNPVFNENVRLSVPAVDTSLKCELWMLSRVKNYLEDQLLGFALIPLSEVVVNGKLEKEFSLSSTDLFHSPAGFVQLSLSYKGASPVVMAIPAATVQNLDVTKSHPSDLDMIEFPDPNIVFEDQIMVSEYFGIPCSNLDSERSESLAISEGENHLSTGIAAGSIPVVESCSIADKKSSQASKIDSPPPPPPNGLPTDVVSSHSLPATSEAPSSSKPTIEEHVSAPNAEENGENENENDSSSETITNPAVVSVSIEPEEKDKVVQQDIVDMYMKSMQQFTESLAKMKLPLDIDSGPPSSGSSSSDPNTQSSKNSGSRVFYGSRAFF